MRRFACMAMALSVNDNFILKRFQTNILIAFLKIHNLLFLFISPLIFNFHFLTIGQPYRSVRHCDGRCYESALFV